MLQLHGTQGIVAALTRMYGGGFLSHALCVLGISGHYLTARSCQPIALPDREIATHT
jgi:hypothetical protein